MPIDAKQNATQDIITALEAGALRYNIIQRYPLTDVAATHEAQDSGQMIAKPLLSLPNP